MWSAHKAVGVDRRYSTGMIISRGPQQAEILLEIRNPKQYFPIISVKYGNSYHVNCNVRHRATVFNRTLLIVGSRIGGFLAQ